MLELAAQDPEGAARVRTRATASWDRLKKEFPGDPVTGMLALDAEGGLPESFEAFADHEPCPALDPVQGTCDVYAARPLTCRVFGPPIRIGDGQVEDGYGLCELCFQTATPAEIAGAALNPVPAEAEIAADQAAIAFGTAAGSSVLAYVLANGLTAENPR